MAGWYRHITLAMFALAFLTVVKVAGQKGGPISGARSRSTPSLTVPSAPTALEAGMAVPPTLEAVLYWSRWRRRHQQVKKAHIKRRAARFAA